MQAAPAGGELCCPRCDSMDTKFCYYNNYNVNNPATSARWALFTCRAF